MKVLKTCYEKSCSYFEHLGLKGRTFIRLQTTLAILYAACYLQRELRQKLHMNI